MYNAMVLPGARRGDDGSRNSRIEVFTAQVSFSSTGREWAAISGEGLHVYSLDDDMIFDPISLTEEITPERIHYKVNIKENGIALKMALHLNEYAMIQYVVENTSFKSIPFVVRSLGAEHLERTLQFIATQMEESPHIEFYLKWCLEVLQTHGMHMEKHRGSFMRAFRSLHKVVQTRHDELKTICDENKYSLAFIQNQGQLICGDKIDNS
mmetsp:Transcript_6215/g.8957  ORF Transcript_6215/g.8957 Transcript_6215/m.8957 type:complete len:210 (+) Transcript_6215:780-1409(+)